MLGKRPPVRQDPSQDFGKTRTLPEATADSEYLGRVTRVPQGKTTA